MCCRRSFRNADLTALACLPPALPCPSTCPALPLPRPLLPFPLPCPAALQKLCDGRGFKTVRIDGDALLVDQDGDNAFTSEWLLQRLKKDGPRLVNKKLAVALNPHGQGAHGRLSCMKSLFTGINEYEA